MPESRTVGPTFCSGCGSRLRPGARFCANCGKEIVLKPPRHILGSKEEESSKAEESSLPPLPPQDKRPRMQLPQPPARQEVPPPPPPEPEAAPVSEPEIHEELPSEELEDVPGSKLTLEEVPLAARGRVVLALRQVLGLSPQDAGAYVAAAPVLLAVGLSAETAHTLASALTNAGAQVTVSEPPPPPEKPRRSEPVPEPKRRMERVAETIQRMQVHTGLRTVTGLDIGNTLTYLSFCRANGETLVAPPEMLRFEARTSIPSAIQPARAGFPMTFGDAALQAWVKEPETVSTQLLENVGENDDILPVLQRFLEVLADRINEVLMPGALSIAEGATTTLGVPADWDQGRIERLVHAVTTAGFPVNRVAPRPLAALIHHLQQGTLKQGAEDEKTLVVDWGGSKLALSFVEHGPGLPKPRVFEHFEHELGGRWFDDVLMQRIRSQLPPELDGEDLRSLVLFTRTFKEQMSRGFSEGKPVHTQYCVIPAGSPPIRVRLDQKEFEELTREGYERFHQALLDGLETVGLQAGHIDHVILAGGGAQWYFAREVLRSTLNQVPLVGAVPQEAFARGLAVYRLIF